MALTVNTMGDKTTKAWFLRWLLGLSMIIDGLVVFFSFGLLSPGLTLSMARVLARARLS